MILAPRYLPRLASIVGLFTNYGLRDFAKNQGLLSVQGAELATDGDAPADDGQDKAVAFRKRLVELGPAYVKLGQVLSTRPDLLPAPYIRELEHLQDSVGEMEYATVTATIEAELGAKVTKLFSRFDEKPIGTASLGQVHSAALRDGREVVIKVQRPNLREQLSDDIEFFRELATFLSAHTAASDRVDIVGVVKQVERSLADELDYLTEARNSATFRKMLAGFPHMLIPRVIEAYTTHKVLTTERIKGVKISDIPAISRVDHDFSTLAEELAHAYLHMITVEGHFHADPHPGNIFVVLPGRENPLTPGELVAADRRNEVREAATPLSKLEIEAREAATDVALPGEPKLALIDFGMTAHLPQRLRDNIVRLLMGIAENHGEQAAETLIEMGESVDSFDRKSYETEIAGIIAQHVDQSVGDMPAGAVLFRMIDTGYKKGLKLPAELTLLAKALFNLDAVTRSLDPTFNPQEAVRDYTSSLADERARRDFSPRRLYQIATEASDFLGALPHRLDVITKRIAANDVGLRLDTPQLGTLLEGMQKIANRIFTGLVLAGLLVASGLMIQSWPRLGIIGFTLAAVLAVYMVLTILISDRKRDDPGSRR